jgi:hypothetical protein
MISDDFFRELVCDLDDARDRIVVAQRSSANPRQLDILIRRIIRNLENALLAAQHAAITAEGWAGRTSDTQGSSVASAE